MKAGTKVRMSEDLKQQLKRNGCSDYVHEFGQCIGIVQGTDNPGVEPADVDVRWQPSNLRYTHLARDLVIA